MTPRDILLPNGYLIISELKVRGVQDMYPHCVMVDRGTKMQMENALLYMLE